MTNLDPDHPNIGQLDAFVTSGSRGWAEYYSESGDLFLRITNIDRDHLAPNLNNCKYVLLPEKGSEGIRTRVQPRDILISITADLGAISFIDDSFQKIAYINQHISLVRISRKDVNNKYVAYFLASDLGKKQFYSLNDTGSKSGLNLDAIRRVKIWLPEKRQQDAIVDKLSMWEYAITIKERLINAKKEMQNGLMQQLLSGQRRFPGFSSEWKEVKLGDIAKRIIRKNTINNTNVLTISAQMGLVSQLEYYKKNVASADLSTYYLMKKGDFAYNKSYSAGYPYGAIKRLELYDKGVVSSLYVCFEVSHPECDQDFFTHFFEAGMLNHGIYRIAQEGARNHGLLNISVHDFFKIKFNIPDIDEQKKIANTLNMIDKELSLLNQELEAYKVQKKGLMQQLLTGKKRVKVTEAT